MNIVPRGVRIGVPAKPSGGRSRNARVAMVSARIAALP
jgi:hypothetical protein